MAAPDGTLHVEGRRRRSLSASIKRDAIINRSSEVDEGGDLPRTLVASPSKVFQQDEVKLLMSPTSVADQREFLGAPTLVL